MQKETIINSVTVGQSLQRTYTVGEEVNGSVVIEIKNVSEQFEDHVHSEYLILNEDNQPIVHIENMPVIVDWKTIVVDEEESFNYEVSVDVPF